MKQIGVGILGFGTVGAGVADGLLKHRDVMARRLGVDIVLRKIADLDITTDRGIDVPEVTAEMLTSLRSAIIEEEDPTRKLQLARRAISALTDKADQDIIRDEIAGLEPETKAASEK